MASVNKSVCIVASTLPAAFIATQVVALDIDKIIVMNRDLEASYQVLKNWHPALKIVRAPSSMLIRNLFLLFELFSARTRGVTVVFFHECCLTFFDLSLMLVKPSGFYFPQVSMYGFEEIAYDEFPKQKVVWLIKLLGLVKNFRFFKCPQIGSGPAEYVISIRRYPETIIQRDVAYSRKIISLAANELDLKPLEDKILFITGKSFIADEIQIGYYLELIQVAHSKGYACHIKDHPNSIYRLNLMSDKAVIIDPLTPSELLDRNYKYIIGVSSSALLVYGDRAISLLKLINEMKSADRDLLIDHFEKAVPGNYIKYIDKIEEFERLL